MKKRISLLNTAQRAKASCIICDNIKSYLDNSITNLNIASFAGLSTEPDLSELFVDLPQHQFLYPRITSDGKMEFHTVKQLTNLELGPYKIKQPIHDHATLVHPANIDLFLCPGLAFTESGKRLGKGGGYYDRILAERSSSSRLIGICFSNQILQSLPIDLHDIELDHVISA